MIILSTIALCAVTVYHESRSTSFTEEFYVASTIYNRAAAKNKSVKDIVFEKNQYSSMSKYKPITKFNTWSDMMKYYNINDLASYATSLNACGYASENTNNLFYFHDKRIKQFKWNATKPSVVTNSFKFYESN